jgi:hypothetical protein
MYWFNSSRKISLRKKLSETNKSLQIFLYRVAEYSSVYSSLAMTRLMPALYISLPLGDWIK